MQRNDEVEISNSEIYNLLQKVLASNQKLEAQVEEIKQQNAKIEKKITQEVEIVKTQVLDLQQENIKLKTETDTLKKKIEEFESKLKKYNIIVYGLKEETDELQDIKKFLTLVNESLEVDCKFTDLRDYFRIGKKEENKIRPIAIECINRKLKEEILLNSRKLKGKGVFITQDLTRTEYEVKKVLYKYFKIAKAKGLKTKIGRKVLYVNDRQYTYEELIEHPDIWEKIDLDGLRLETNEEEIVSEEEENIEKEEDTIPGRSGNKKRKERSPVKEAIVKRSNRIKKTAYM